MPDGARPSEVEVVIEVPRGSRIKRAADGSVDFVSPFASPFNYGSVPELPSPDGEPMDAVVLGPPLSLGHRAMWPVHGVVHFLDEGLRDDKLICGPRPPDASDDARIRSFFARYAKAKAWIARVRGRGPVRFEGWERW